MLFLGNSMGCLAIVTVESSRTRWLAGVEARRWVSASAIPSDVSLQSGRREGPKHQELTGLQPRGVDLFTFYNVCERGRTGGG